MTGAEGERHGIRIFGPRRACLILALSLFLLQNILSQHFTLEGFSTATTATEHKLETMNQSDVGGLQGNVDPNHQMLSEVFHVRNSNSDVAYLQHCNLSAVNDTVFFMWMDKILSDKNISSRAESFGVNASDVKDELTLQGLEVFSKALGLCNFSLYQPTVPDDAVGLVEAGNLLKGVPQATSGSEARIAFVIITFKDVIHLEELIRALHMPHHLIIVHLERRAEKAFAATVKMIAKGYRNVAVLQYGSITYPTDQVSYINLQIMRWLLFDLQLVYDHHVTMGATAYPLMSAKDMAQHLAKEPPRVRLGIMTYNRGADLCRRKCNSFGLTYSRGLGMKDRMVHQYNMMEFFSKIAMKTFTLLDGFPSDLNAFLPRAELQQKCDTKSNSGNTAIFDYNAVRSLLSSPNAMEFLSHFKYVGGCCAEENSWFGALKIAGRGDVELRKPGAMWQSWPCRGGMKNAVLQTGSKSCYRVIDTAGGWGRRDIKGDLKIRNELINARKRGHLFARKIDGSVQESVALRDWISRTLLHNNRSQW